MTDQRLISLIDRLRLLSDETEWLEFKRNQAQPQLIGEYLSALANSACLARQPRGYLLFGIDDESHEVVGTSFNPSSAKGKGGQALLPWLSSLLSPRTGFEVSVVDHPGGQVVILEVMPAGGQPVSFSGTSFIRHGSSKTQLRNHPEKERALWTIGQDWSSEIVETASLDDLDPEALEVARRQFIEKHPGQAGEVTGWDNTRFLNKARVLVHGHVTRTALLLLGRHEASTLLAPAEAKISWILKDESNRELDYEHFGPPFLTAGDRLLSRIRNLTVRELPGGTLFPREITQYDTWVVREALHNAIAHQDYFRQGRISVVEFPDRILITNLGDFLPGDVETVVRQDAPQAQYRNPFLANAMVELNLIDTQGGGIKRMFETQRRRSFPLPDYDVEEPGRVAVSIVGKVIDEQYTRLLMQNAELDLEKVMLLDRVQKKKKITKEEHKVLKAADLVEGRFPNLMVSGDIAKAAGESGRHIRERGFDKKYYRDLILTLLEEHGPVSRTEINDLLLPKLPERLDDNQKRWKVGNLLQELRRAKLVENRGSRSHPQWVVVEKP